MKCGSVGLPNVGKSTLFNALTKAGIAAENYPFCTIEPNVGIVEVPDARMAALAEIVKPQRMQYAITEFVDIAGLVAGFVQGVEIGARRQNEALVLEQFGDQFGMVAVFLGIDLVVVLPDIGDVLQEEHGQHVVLVDAGIDGATEGIAGGPDGSVDSVLIDGVVHDQSRLSLNSEVQMTETRCSSIETKRRYFCRISAQRD